MNPDTRENWRKIKHALEAANKTDCFYYKRAVAILAGRPDPLAHPPLPDLDTLNSLHPDSRD